MLIDDEEKLIAPRVARLALQGAAEVSCCSNGAGIHSHHLYLIWTHSRSHHLCGSLTDCLMQPILARSANARSTYIALNGCLPNAVLSRFTASRTSDFGNVLSSPRFFQSAQTTHACSSVSLRLRHDQSASHVTSAPITSSHGAVIAPAIVNIPLATARTSLPRLSTTFPGFVVDPPPTPP